MARKLGIGLELTCLVCALVLPPLAVLWAVALLTRRFLTGQSVEKEETP